MALDESTENLEAISSNGITIYVDPKLLEMLQQLGKINIDFVTGPHGQGYSVQVGDAGQCGGGCDSC